MDTDSSKSPIKVWLLLGLVILMLHLMLLKALPMHLGGLPGQMTTFTFETRNVIEEALRPAVPLLPAQIRTPRQRSALPEPMAPPQADLSVAAQEPESPQRVNDLERLDNAELTGASSDPPVEADPEPPPPPTAAPRQLREAAMSLHADRVPASIKLIYEVQTNKFPYSLNGELVWVSHSKGYEASLMFGAFGQRRIQTSRGQMGADGLMPERFSDKFRSEVAAHFNRPLAKITFSANTPDAPLLAGAQDRLSVLIQLAALVASSPERFAPATTLTIQTVGPRDADLWLFTVGPTETLSLPGGQLELVKLTRNPRQAYDQQVDIWLASTLGYLPARIRITEASGDYVDLKWLRSESAQPS